MVHRGGLGAEPGGNHTGMNLYYSVAGYWANTC